MCVMTVEDEQAECGGWRSEEHRGLRSGVHGGGASGQEEEEEEEEGVVAEGGPQESSAQPEESRAERGLGDGGGRM